MTPEQLAYYNQLVATGMSAEQAMATLQQAIAAQTPAAAQPVAAVVQPVPTLPVTAQPALPVALPVQAQPVALPLQQGPALQIKQAGEELNDAPASGDVEQLPLPVGFNIMNCAIHKQVAEKTSRTPPWECTVEELRERVTFRDVQAPSNRNANEYHLRAFLSPKSLDMGVVLGNDANGAPINTIMTEPKYAEAVKEEFLNTIVKPGHFDKLLLETAQEMLKSKQEKDAAPKKAPVNTESADAALAELETMGAPSIPDMPATMPAMPAGIQAPAMPANVPAMPAMAAPVLGGIPAMPAMPAMPTMPAGLPTLG